MLRALLLACLTLAGIGLLTLSATGTSTPVHAQTSLAPDECVCSKGLVIDTVSGSRVLNCQCGAMQCVVVTGSGALECR